MWLAGLEMCCECKVLTGILETFRKSKCKISQFFYICYMLK